MICVLIHGVPDTPAMWGPLKEQLSLSEEAVITPALPGFGSPAPKGFECTKEAYIDWLIDILETNAAKHGPVDLVGHDWGALLCLRAIHLRPDLIRSWAITNAVLLPEIGWHSLARIWQTPIKGELFMIYFNQKRLKKVLLDSAMPEDIATIEATHFDRHMKRAILKLYRSALTMNDEWAVDLSGLPERGLVLWGEKDKFVPIKFGKKFCDKWSIPFHVIPDTGHWANCERPEIFAEKLKQHWDR